MTSPLGTTTSGLCPHTPMLTGVLHFDPILMAFYLFWGFTAFLGHLLQKRNFVVDGVHAGTYFTLSLVPGS